MSMPFFRFNILMFFSMGGSFCALWRPLTLQLFPDIFWVSHLLGQSLSPVPFEWSPWWQFLDMGVLKKTVAAVFFKPAIFFCIPWPILRSTRVKFNYIQVIILFSAYKFEFILENGCVFRVIPDAFLEHLSCHTVFKPAEALLKTERYYKDGQWNAGDRQNKNLNMVLLNNKVSVLSCDSIHGLETLT